MIKYYYILILLLFTKVLLAQNTISGKITDLENHSLYGAAIFIPDINKGTTSDENGFYTLENLPNGKLKIQITLLSYSSKIETIIMEGFPKELNAVLTPIPIETEEIVITGGYTSSQHENAVKIESLKLNPMNLSISPNFTEMLTKVPGIDMISKGSGVSKPVIRGLSMNDILILNNGVRFENYQYSSHHPLGIDEFGIADVEIIKGPASLLYGSDAIGGVINFIKEKPAPVETIIGDYNLQLFSNSLGMSNNFGIKGSSGNFFAGIRAGQKSNADYLEGGGTFVPNSRFHEYSVKANAGYTSKKGTYKLFYDYNNQNLGLVEEEAIDLVSGRGRKCEVYYQNLNTHLISSQNKIYLGKSRLDILAAYQNTELIHFGDMDEFELQMKLGTLTYETRLNFSGKKNSEYILGLQGLHQKNTNINQRETILLPDALTQNFSVFGMMQFKFKNKLTFQSGLRFDLKSIESEQVGNAGDPEYRSSLSRAYNSFSGSIGATYAFSEHFLLRSNLASAFRTPNLAELTSNGQHETRFETGDENLVPEKSIELDISMHYHIENLTVDLAAFYNHIRDYIFINPTGDTTLSGLYIYQYRQANSELFGGEAGIHYHPADLEWFHFETTFSHVTGRMEKEVFLPFIPADKLDIEFRIDDENLWFLYNAYFTVQTNYAFAQNNISTDETPTEDYYLINLATGFQLKIKKQMIGISMGINNLLDKKYIDHLSTLKEVNRYNPGRNIFLNLNIPFSVK